MGNCGLRGNLSTNRVSSNAKSDSPEVQSPEEKEEVSNLPSNPEEVEDLRRDSAANPLVAFSFSEIKLITENFRKSYLLGVGGFGSVYRGFITQHPEEGLQPLQVAVKVHDADNGSQGHREWLVLNSIHTSHNDVYSFGVVLLELLTGKRSLDKSRPVKQRALVDWAAPSLADKKKVLHIVDPKLDADCPQSDAQKVARLACHCLDQNPKARPLMRDLVDLLEPLQRAV
ncbi:hypothetical protein C4D60_Mb07t00240 [Musa balbisiana]|uniref:Serine-threonine/tyrosine-protein kinase catalytic domain-containing protein n=1 Tax=Musa balbisiana TaxID=52838 RepID=A0A4S8JBW9_MUSBA|nr:hypothetical protein C4D60_Mb07t00240 [Musa balbisiana]